MLVPQDSYQRETIKISSITLAILSEKYWNWLAILSTLKSTALEW